MSIIQTPAVIKKSGYKRSSIYKFVKDGTFPQPAKLSARSNGWWIHEVDEWVKAKMNGMSEAGLKQLVSDQIKNRQAI